MLPEYSFRVMKSTLDARPVYVRRKEHIVAHLTVCSIALLLIRLIQRQIKNNIPEHSSEKLFEFGLSANRIQDALNKWKVEKLGETYYRFQDIDDPDLDLILKSFGINLDKKCYTLGELKHLKQICEMST